ncbi:ATP-binding cassette domain-containing protein [Xanthobacter sp. KR7-225]|uniref:ATP-binding cassette domain-containing protein n=1 Tax=Xanthobacter sp. KR7-225 TaxID=3156613 RepID=UPI0032B3AEE5
MNALRPVPSPGDPAGSAPVLATFADARLGYGDRTVFERLSLSVRQGERVALLGRSGAGKSTLIAALYRRLSDAGARVALVPQDHALVPQLSVFHNIYMGRLDRHGAFYNAVNLVRPFRRERDAVAPLAEELGLGPDLLRPVERLSGGQRQRTAVGRAWFRGGDVLLADEPVSAVDEAQARRILAAMAGRFATLILSLHAVDLARESCDRIVGLRAGAVVIDAPAAAVTRAELDGLYAR